MHECIGSRRQLIPLVAIGQRSPNSLGPKNCRVESTKSVLYLHNIINNALAHQTIKTLNGIIQTLDTQHKNTLIE